MNLDARRRLVRRLDVLILLGLLLSSGLAALFFSLQFYAAEEEATAQSVAPTQTATATLTATPTATSTDTHTPTPTSSHTPTRTPPPSATATPSPIGTPWPTPEVHTPSPAYVGQTPVLTGRARPHDTVHIYDERGQWIGGRLALDDGRWAVSLPPQTVAGVHDLQVVAISAQGAKSAPVIVRMEVRPVPSPVTPSATITHTPSATPTATATHTPSMTFSHTPSPSATSTPSTTPSATATLTATPSFSPSRTPTATHTSTSTPSATPTATATVPSSTTLPRVVAQMVSSTPSPSPSRTSSTTATVMFTETATQALPFSTPSAPTITVARTPTFLAAPRIDDPTSGAVYSPGALTVRGHASAGAEVWVQEALSGQILGEGWASPEGTWKITLTLSDEGELVLVAVVQATDGARAVSDPVLITIAPPLHPATGGVLTTTDPKTAGRAFTALLALLLVAGGFSVFFAGRLVYMVARGRKHP